MSQEDVERFKRVIEAWNRRDVEAVLKDCDPAIELHMALQTLVGGEAAVYRGHDGVRAYLRDIDEAFAEVHAEYAEIRDLGDRILAIGRFRARGMASGAEIETPLGTLVEARDGKATRIQTFLDPEEALAAAGLPE
jgi:ketosteroid isomerase-like protein